MAKETFREKRDFQKYTDAQVKEVLAQLESGKSFCKVSKDHNKTKLAKRGEFWAS